MSTPKRFTHDRSEGYFDQLPAGTQALVKELLLQAASDRSGPEGFKSDDECVEGVECRARDGFSPFSHNRGGLIYQNFAQWSDYWGGGYRLSHKLADTRLQELISSALEDATQQLIDEMGAEDFEYYFSSDKTKVNYPYINEMIRTLSKGNSEYGFKGENVEKLKEWLSRIQDLENESMSGENSTVMHELRVMYHGKEDGIHSASVSAAVNLEAPYHRSHISWAPDVFCEGGKEVEITWRNQAELKRKLARALKQVSKAVF